MRTFWSLGDFEFYLVSLLQAFVAFGCDRAEVNEYVGAIFASDKTVSLGIVKPLHRTFQTFHLRPLGHVPCQAVPPDFLPLCDCRGGLSIGEITGSGIFFGWNSVG